MISKNTAYGADNRYENELLAFVGGLVWKNEINSQGLVITLV